MALLIVGVLLWAYSHLMKRVTPKFRASLGDNNGKMVAAGLSLLAIIFMVVGYRSAEVVQLWNPPLFLKHINNLLMLISLYFFAASGMQTALARKLRHPMLWGAVLWAVAHLLVNGDAPSFVLFGGIGLWALAQMVLINRAGPWAVPPAKPAKFEAMALVGALLVYGAIAGVHTWLGYPTFG